MTIRDVQTALQAQGFDSGGIDGIAGPKTYKGVTAFQQARGLISDGVIRWDTLNILFPDVVWSKHLATRAVQIAETQVGIREATGKNDGLEVEAYLKTVGLTKGYSYCMAFVVWCFEQAAASLGVKSPLIRTGGVLDQYNRTGCAKILVSQVGGAFIPMPGDIFIINLGNGHGHTGLVRPGDAGTGHFNTVEANTNDDGSANGDGDYFRVRETAKMYGFIRVE